MKFRYILIGLTLLGMTSCNNWLDVTPQGQVEGSDLLTNEKGYNAALNDVYYTLTLWERPVIRHDGCAGTILGFVGEEYERLLPVVPFRLCPCQFKVVHQQSVEGDV